MASIRFASQTSILDGSWRLAHVLTQSARRVYKRLPTATFDRMHASSVATSILPPYLGRMVRWRRWRTCAERMLSVPSPHCQLEPPAKWKIHYPAPISKKSSVYSPMNYRGVHLISPLLSKVAERLIGGPLISHLATNHFGINQCGSIKKRSARDLSTLCLCTWIWTICRGKKIASFLSGIMGAFDKIFNHFLFAKLDQA